MSNVPTASLGPAEAMAYVLILLLVFFVGWLVWTVRTGIPAPIRVILERNYLTVVVYPFWALICWAFVFLIDKTSPQNTFNVDLWGLRFEGAGGPAIIWVLVTTLGMLIIGKKWKDRVRRCRSFGQLPGRIS